MALIDELVESARARARALPPRAVRSGGGAPSFRDAVRGKTRVDVVAEFKQKSPSLGDIAVRSVAHQTRLYELAGAAAISVLTEPTRFRGSYSDLEIAASSVGVPVLMKDFVVDPAQLREAAHLGASAVLLIVRCLSVSELRELASAAEEYGLTPLVECHDAREVETALRIEDSVIGINNRDLDTLEMDTARAPRLLEIVPRDRVVVAESGYLRGSDVDAVRGNVDAVLVGSALMKLDDPSELIRSFRGETR